MTVTRRDFLKLGGLAAVGVATAGVGVGAAFNWTGASVIYPRGVDGPMHLLNRLTWGPRKSDLDKLNELGPEGYIDWQLNYESIPDPDIDAFMVGMTAMSMNHHDLDALVEKNYNDPYDDMIFSRIYRAAFSERQLFELMVEFWTDHFNVPLADYLTVKIVDDREVIRKHALGKFSDLLQASAKSPAMLIYLNTADSNKEYPNENYAREVMELHTLGVAGGYTEADVKAVARAFTGWTVDDDVPGMFMFDERVHDYNEKTVLGHTLAAEQDGIQDGLQVLDILAKHESTAKHIARKLCVRFVSDNPPQGVVDSASKAFMETGGDIRKVMKVILTHGDFVRSGGQKFRRPMDVVAAMIRVTGAKFDYPPILQEALVSMGHLPFGWIPPNGYPDSMGAWLNTGALLNRWNTGMLIAGAAYDDSGIHIPYDILLPASGASTAAELVDSATQLILNGKINADDRAQLIDFVTDGGAASTRMTHEHRETKLPALVGLLLSSPYFQWH